MAPGVAQDLLVTKAPANIMYHSPMKRKRSAKMVCCLSQRSHGIHLGVLYSLVVLKRLLNLHWEQIWQLPPFTSTLHLFTRENPHGAGSCQRTIPSFMPNKKD